MEFLNGMIVGLIVGCTIGTIIGSVLVRAKLADRDYESEQNAPNSTGVDW